MAEADVIGALVEALKADGDVSALAGADVFGGELPKRQAKHMPRAAIVLKPSGGASIAAGSFIDHDTQRIDLFAFAASAKVANTLARISRRSLTNIRRQVISGCLIHWVEPAGGFSARRDGVTQWPMAFQPFQVFYALQEVS